MPTHKSERQWVDVRTAAEHASLSQRTIRQRIADGVLPAYIPAGSRLVRIDLADVDRMVEGERIASAHLAERTATRVRK